MDKDKKTSSSYQGLSRTYRPQTFQEVIGQEAIITTLKNALQSGKTAQAYLFCGTRGTGKTTLARVLAKSLNCSTPSSDHEPCNQCTSCVEISLGKNLNVFEIDGASHRGIDDIRQLNETAVYAPSSKGYKVFIIDEAHMLTKEAFNALLKTLEEPPPNVKFFLATTEPHKIPPTILSRCQRFDLQRIATAEILEKLQVITKDLARECDEKALYQIANLADGSMRVAESLLDQVLCFSKDAVTEESVTSSLSILPTDPFFALDTAFKEYDLPYAFTWAASIFSSGKDLSYFLDSLLDHYRNIVAVQLKMPLPDLHPSLLKKYQGSAMIYTEEQALYILDSIVGWIQQHGKTPFKRVFLEMILLHILRSKHRVSAADLVCKIEEMQASAPPIPKEAPKETIAIQQELRPIEPAPAKAPQVKKEKAPPPPKPPQQEKKAPLPPGKPSNVQQDTLMQFASVELEGLLTKNS